jgi:hypothetical protein
MAAASCGAKTRSGGECRQPRGNRTDHPGFGRCWLHGGASPNGRKTAAFEMGRASASAAEGVAIDPLEALARLLRVAAGDWLDWEARVAALDGPIVETRHGPRLRLECVVLDSKREQVKSFAVAAHTAGVEEREVKVVELLASGFADVLARILDGLALTPAQRERAPEIVRAELRALEGGASG